MGNTCCASESRAQDTNYSMTTPAQGGSSRNPNRALVKANKDGLNEPDPESAQKVTAMNKMNAKVQEQHDQRGAYKSTKQPKKDMEGLPVLGPYKYQNGATYQGQYKLGLRHGWGTIVWEDGSCYEGFWENDMSNGDGRLIHVGGDVYIGDWVDDMAHGQGSYYHVDKTVYIGQWERDKQSGKGKETWADGSEYEGLYKNSLKHGKGVFKWNDGSVYEGEFFKNAIQGFGITHT